MLINMVRAISEHIIGYNLCQKMFRIRYMNCYKFYVKDTDITLSADVVLQLIERKDGFARDWCFRLSIVSHVY